MSHNFFLFICDRNQLIDNSIDWFFDLNENFFDNFNFYDSLLENWDLDLFLNLSYNYFLYLSNNYFLNNLWHLNDFLNYSWNYHNLLNYSLNLNYLRHLNHFLYYLLHLYSDLLDTFDITRNFDDSFLNISDWFRHLHVMIDYFLYFDQFWLINYHRIAQINLFDDCVLNSFDDRFLYNLSDFLNDFLNKRNLYNFFYFDRDFPNYLNKLFHNNFDWLDNFFSDKFFSNNLNFSDFYLFDNYLHDFFNDLRHLNYTLNSSDNRNNLLNNTVDWFMDCFDMVVNL